jgi:S1-C subfamily serine protease
MASMPGRRSRARISAWAAVALAAVLALVVGCAAHGANPAAGRGPLQNAYELTIRKVLRSVVEIDAGASTGSGVVFDTRGDIVTNAHVVGKAKKFEVRASVTSEPLKAKLIGLFTPDDLAVIRVLKGSHDLKPVRWADSAKAQVGQIVLAMGSPFGLIDSVTQGIVSATGRTVNGPTISGKTPSVIVNAVQTSAAINPGNSGGALVLLSGFVLGIPSLTAEDPAQGHPAQGIGFAIPANTVVDISRQLIESGKVTQSGRASLGIRGATHVNSAGTPDGVTVEQAASGGAAHAAGIRAGDVIAGIGGQPTPDMAYLEDKLTQYRPGDRVRVEVLRQGNPREVIATLGSLGS